MTTTTAKINQQLTGVINNSRLWKNHGAILDKKGDFEVIEQYKAKHGGSFFRLVYIVAQNLHHKCPINKKFRTSYMNIEPQENGSWNLVIKDVWGNITDVVEINTTKDTVYTEFCLLGLGQPNVLTFESDGLKYILSVY